LKDLLQVWQNKEPTAKALAEGDFLGIFLGEPGFRTTLGLPPFDFDPPFLSRVFSLSKRDRL
jgi:hypothetical protein